MKNSYQKKDFNKTSLPSTRMAQLKDLFTTNISLVLLCALFLFVSLIPQTILLLYKSASLSAVYTSYANQEITISESQSLISSTYVFFDLIQFITIFFLFFVICGLLRVLRVSFWNEGVFFFSDFFKGIKNNIGRSILYSLVVSMCLFVKDEIYYYLCNTGYSWINIINYLIAVLISSVFMPIICISMELDNYYNYSLSDARKTAIKFYLSSFFKFLVLSLPLLLIYIFDISYSLTSIIIICISLIFIPSPLLLTFHSICLKLFDEYINPHHKEILNKGLYIEEDKLK